MSGGVTFGGVDVDTSRAFDLSRRVRFDGSAPLAFFLPPAQSVPVAAGGFVGSVAHGGSCNCHVHTLTPHGDGTHTEGVGHVVAQGPAVIDALQLPLLRCRVLTVAPVALSSVTDEVVGNSAPTDTVIAAAALLPAFGGAAFDALAIRTGHGDVTAFSGHNPTYLTATAARLLRERGVNHVLVELPSLDREDDGGFLGAHRAFFGLAAAQKTWSGEAPHHTITELCRMGSDVVDGDYALSLQLAPLHSDAVPSRPLLFALHPSTHTGSSTPTGAL